MAKIRVLDEHTINKIAAGEVIENPASVVKELVENSIDAESSEICIEIKGGGRQLIRITDNGCGMNEDDALLCLERHATSKIKGVDDICSIDTMGFRGEAIPSIAAISKFTLITNHSDKEKGRIVIVEGGKLIKCTEAARSKGTTIEVKSLFFNVPVRKKFQKSPAYDINEIEKMIINISLGYPSIRFELISDLKKLIDTSRHSNQSFSDHLGKRIQELLGKEFFAELVELNYQKGNLSIEGFVGMPSLTRNNRTGQYLFINHRAVQCALVSYAVREGYGTMIPTGRHPVFVLHLKLPGNQVDVNVHPQKREVRLRQESTLRAIISQAVSEAFHNVKLLPWESPSNIIPLPEISFPAANEEPVFPSIPQPTIPPPRLNRDISFQPTFTQQAPKTFIPRVLATVKNFIIIDSPLLPTSQEGIFLIDQRAAHARVLFEQFLKKNEKIGIQNFLIPYTFTVLPEESQLLLSNLETLAKIGFCIYQNGPLSFCLEAIPQSLNKIDCGKVVLELLQSLKECNKTLIKEIEKHVAMAASRAAISTQQRLAQEEAQALINELVKCDNPNHCPSGKPTMICIGFHELQSRS